jgi:tetratricopeptide (TPR) repeat protein
METYALPLLHELNTSWDHFFPDSDSDQSHSPVRRFFNDLNLRVLSSGAASTDLPESTPFREAVGTKLLRSTAQSRLILYGLARALCRLHAVGVCYPLTPEKIFIDKNSHPHIQITGSEPPPDGIAITFAIDIESYVKFAADLLRQELPTAEAEDEVAEEAEEAPEDKDKEKVDAKPSKPPEPPKPPPMSAHSDRERRARLLITKIRQRLSFIDIACDIANPAMWTPETNSETNRGIFDKYKSDLDLQEQKALDAGAWLTGFATPSHNFAIGARLPGCDLDAVKSRAAIGDQSAQIRAAMLALTGNYEGGRNIFYAVKLLDQQRHLPYVDFFLKCLARGSFLHRGILAEVQGNIEEARELYKKGALDRDKEAAVRYAASLVGTPLQRAGLRLLDNFAQTGDLLANFTLADICYRSQITWDPGQDPMKKAVDAFDRACEAVKDSAPEPWFFAGKVRFEQQKWEDAAVRLKKAIAIVEAKWPRQKDVRESAGVGQGEGGTEAGEQAGEGEGGQAQTETAPSVLAKGKNPFAITTPDGVLVDLAQRMISDIASITRKKRLDQLLNKR